MAPLTGRASLVFALLVACGDAAPPADPGNPAPPAPPSVPIELPALALDGVCVELDVGERVAGVGSEGELWLATDAASTVRVVLADGAPQALDLRVAPTVLRPWSDVQAAFAIDARIFVREGEGPLQEVGWPRELGAVVDLCGDPRLDGAFVIAAGEGDVGPGLYRRAGGEWWRWTPPSGSFGAGMSLASVSGACTADDDRAWLRSASGLYALREDRLDMYGRVDAVAIDRHVGVAALSEGKLLFLRDGAWQQTRFEAGAVELIASAAGHLWVLAADRLYHYADGAFALARLALPGPIEALHADAAGGLWVETGAQVCHRAPSGVLRVRGVRAFERRMDPVLALSVEGDAMRVEVDGGAVHDGGGDAMVDLGAPGWHRLEIRVGELARRFDVMRVDSHAPTWEDDVRPIAVAHCAGSACHGAERDDATRPALADYESWVALAEAIRHRVGVVGDMPPPVAREGWTADEVTTVVAWIAAGMEERDASE